MQGALKYCNILGTNINVTDMDKTIEYLFNNLEEMRGQYVCVSNVHTTVMAYRDPEYQNVQNSGAMALPDGQPLSMVSRKRGYKDARRVPGPDLMPEIIGRGIKHGYRHYFYGSSDEILSRLKKQLIKNFPDMQIAGMYAPPFRELKTEEDHEITTKINDTNPDFVWVALGAPKQEKWMYEHRGKIKGIMLGVGAAFDFTAGTVKRAPMWMQKACLEWLYRIGQDPKRLMPRYFSTNFAFVRLVAQEDRRLRRQKREIRYLADKDIKHDSNRNLSIAMIGHKRIPSREGGVELVVGELATRIAAMGYSVTAYNREARYSHEEEHQCEYGKGNHKFYKGIRIKIVPIFNNVKLNAIVYSIFATISSSFANYDIYHFHAEGPCVMLWLPKMMHKRIIVTIHGLDWERAKWGNFASNVIKGGEKQAVKHADKIIVLSRNVQEYFMDTYGRRTIYIPNGVNRPDRHEPQLIRERFGLEKDGYILFVARLVPEKGLDYLINAFRQIKTDKKLLIAGNPNQAEGYYTHVRGLADDDNRILFAGFVQGQLLEELYSNAFAFILPSDVEGMSISLLEAMSYGLCCIVSDIPENTEVTADNAITFKHGNTDDLKVKIQNIIDHPEIKDKYALGSEEYICNKYNWDDVVEKTLNVYKGA